MSPSLFLASQFHLYTWDTLSPVFIASYLIKAIVQEGLDFKWCWRTEICSMFFLSFLPTALLLALPTKISSGYFPLAEILGRATSSIFKISSTLSLRFISWIGFSFFVIRVSMALKMFESSLEVVASESQLWLNCFSTLRY